MNSRRKGHDWERDVVNMFGRAMPGLNVRRGIQTRSGSEVADVEGLPFWVECKVGANPRAEAALRQAQAACGKRDQWPIAVVKRDRSEPYVCIDLADFIELAGYWYRGKKGRPWEQT